LDVVFDLYRVADLMFMPSHQEGFGMPVLEAGLVGLPVAAANTVPAAEEIGGEDVLSFSPDLPPQLLAQQLMPWVNADKKLRLARQTRHNFTWEAIFHKQIEPLLKGEAGL
jgi:glycosyltransferase involved in cell wall biosynthesis